jgi:putative ABC transport system permease protein
VATFPSGLSQTLTVAGIYDDASTVGNYLIDTSTYRANFAGPTLDFFVGATLAEGASLQQVKDDVKTVLLDQAPQVKVQDKDEFRKSQEQQVNILLAVINALLGLAVAIALIGIANTLALSVYERTRELGLLRAVGMLRSQMRGMVRWEAVLVSVFGAVLGVALGIVLGVLVAIALPASVVSTVAVPTLQLLGYILFALVAGIWAARKPAKRAARMNVLEAIAHA